MAGLFVTFEGGEGAGKSTQIRLLADHLRARRRVVTVTTEPGGGSIGQPVRQILLDPRRDGLAPLAELLLVEAARVQHVTEVIRPALERGEVVLCDRYTDSTVAYQAAGRGLDEEVVERLNRLATAGLEPDLTLLLVLPVDVGLARARARDEGARAARSGRFEAEEPVFHRRVHDAFRARAERDPGRVRIVDARPSPEAVAAEIRAIVDEVSGS